MKRRIFGALIATSIVLLGVDAFSMGSDPTPPGQPGNGYGSQDNYIGDKLLGGASIDHQNAIDFGDSGAGTRCWVYIPEVLKNGTSAPVVVYLHGFMVLVPPIYGGQIEHLVKQGYIVIFPEYNLGGFTGMFNDLDQYEMLYRAINATDEALAIPEVAARADLSEVVLASHSNGGLMSLAWDWAGGVSAKSMVMTHPNISNDAIPKFVRDLFLGDMILIDYTTTASQVTCPVIMVGGNEDTIAQPQHLEEIYNVLTNAASKVYYEFKADSFGDPSLEADHMAACQDDGWLPGWLLDLVGGSMGFGAMEEDAIDFRVHYAALDAALDGQTSLSFDMGEWSDGTPVTPVEEKTVLPGDDDDDDDDGGGGGCG